jgi:hypothetical protein
LHRGPGAVQVCLVRKVAECLDGVDVAPYSVGDVIDLPDRQATLLILEGWAVRNRRHVVQPPPTRERRMISSGTVRAVAAHSARRRRPREEPLNFHYDDCEERATREAQAVEDHRHQLTNDGRSNRRTRQKNRVGTRHR